MQTALSIRRSNGSTVDVEDENECEEPLGNSSHLTGFH